MIDTRQYLIQYKDWNKIKQSIKRNKDVINYEETHFGDTLHYSTSRGKYLLSLEANLAYTMYKPSNAFTVPEPTPTDESEYDYYY
jgi:hypothetical protein